MYRKSFYVFDGRTPVPATIRNYTEADFPALIGIQRESFPPPFPQELLWNEEQLGNHVSLFPAGALMVEVAGEAAGSMTGLLVSIDPAHPEHSWEEVTDRGYIRNHNPHGDTLYIVDLCVRPSHRKLGLGKLLMQAMFHVVIQQGRTRLLGGGRMPRYHEYADRLSAKEYLEAVVAGDIQDPVITFMLRCGRVPVGVAANYLEDKESRNYAALMEWRNPFIQNKE